MPATRTTRPMSAGGAAIAVCRPTSTSAPRPSIAPSRVGATEASGRPGADLLHLIVEDPYDVFRRLTAIRDPSASLSSDAAASPSRTSWATTWGCATTASIPCLAIITDGRPVNAPRRGTGSFSRARTAPPRSRADAPGTGGVLLPLASRPRSSSTRPPSGESSIRPGEAETPVSAKPVRAPLFGVRVPVEDDMIGFIVGFIVGCIPPIRNFVLRVVWEKAKKHPWWAVAVVLSLVALVWWVFRWLLL